MPWCEPVGFDASSHLIVAFSNAQPGSRTLGVFDFDRDAIEWIDTAWLGDDVTGFDDVYRDGDHLWLLPQTDDRQSSRLVDIGPTYTRRDVVPLSCGDPHALVRIGDALLVTDTTRNRVCAVRCEQGAWTLGEHVRLAPSDKDVVHLNSIGELGGVPYVSTFGAKPRDGWKFACDGEIIELSTGRVIADRLSHPHSVTSDGARLYWTESSRGRVWSWAPGEAPRTVFEPGGYLRGLAIAGDTMYVGSSAQRTASRSTGVRNVRASDRPDDYESWIFRMSISRGQVDRRLTTHLGAEIFELVPIEHHGSASGVPSGSAPSGGAPASGDG